MLFETILPLTSWCVRYKRQRASDSIHPFFALGHGQHKKKPPDCDLLLQCTIGPIAGRPAQQLR